MISNQDVYDALTVGVEERWKKIRDGENFNNVPSCSLCAIFSRGDCAGCPLDAIGDNCLKAGSTWDSFVNESDLELVRYAADNMISQLESCKLAFFNESTNMKAEWPLWVEPNDVNPYKRT